MNTTLDHTRGGYIGIPELAVMLGVSRKTIARLIQRGTIATVCVPGMRVRIPKAEADRLISQYTVPAR